MGALSSLLLPHTPSRGHCGRARFFTSLAISVGNENLYTAREGSLVCVIGVLYEDFIIRQDIK